MSEDFFDTCGRMFASATTLNGNHEYYNSCYLSGYVVECYLKHLILTFGTKDDGTDFSIDDIRKDYGHNLQSLIHDMNDFISINPNIPASCRFDLNVECSAIVGTSGQLKWHPNYRYGEHPKWSDESCSGAYISEITKLHETLTSLRIGGIL